MNARVKTAIEHWSYVAPLLPPARNAKEYAQLVEALDAAIDAGGADEKHPLARLVDYLGDLVAEYEAKDKMPAAATGADALRYLMQRDSLRQAKALAERFGVSAAFFVIPKIMTRNLNDVIAALSPKRRAKVKQRAGELPTLNDLRVAIALNPAAKKRPSTAKRIAALHKSAA